MANNEQDRMTQEELLELIRQAAREGWTELDLSERDISELPADIGQLVNLKALNLSDNQLTALPDTFGQLANLQQLYLSSNRLTALPDADIKNIRPS